MNWQHTFLMRDLLSDDTSDENAVRVAKELAKRMRESGLFETSTGRFMVRDLENSIETIVDLNGVLEVLWDYCDGHSIWIPMEGERQ